MFSREESTRYARQIRLPQIGIQGQLLLRQTKVLVVGAGGLGCPILQYLVSAGVGHIGIIDHDKVELSNLPRQVLYKTTDIGKPKVTCAAEHLGKMNDTVHLVPLYQKLNFDNVLGIISEYDLVLDGSDNFITKFLINDACLLLKKTFVFGAVTQFEGQVSVLGSFENNLHYSLQQLVPLSSTLSEIPSCEMAGVLGVVPAIIGSIQALEAIKIITKNSQDALIGKVLMVDTLSLEFHKFELASLAIQSVPQKILDYENILKSCDSTEFPKEIDVYELDQRLKAEEQILLIDVRYDWERSICKIPFEDRQIVLDQLEIEVTNLETAVPIVFYCHHGLRSFKALEIFRNQFGKYGEAYSLKGGIDAWAKLIDPSIPIY